MQHLDDYIILELSGVVFELRELEDLKAEIAILPDGSYELLSDNTLSYYPSLVYSWIHREGIENCPQDFYEYYFDKLHKFIPILDKVALKLSEIELPCEKEIKIIPILSLL